MNVNIRNDILYSLTTDDTVVDLTSMKFNTINQKCFSKCNNIETIYLPLRSLRFHKDAFKGCPHLHKVILEKNNRTIKNLQQLYPDIVFEGIRTSNAQINNMLHSLSIIFNFKLVKGTEKFDLVVSILQNALKDNANLNMINTAFERNKLVRQGIDTYSILECAYIER